MDVRDGRGLLKKEIWTEGDEGNKEDKKRGGV
jgi:hypothetical protein